MSRRIILAPAAIAEITHIADWYNERHEGLRNAFLEAVDEALAAIVNHPSQYQVVYRDFRRVLMKRFPYALFYVAADKQITVAACIHGRRSFQRVLRRR